MKELFAHMRWADALTIEALRAAPGGDDNTGRALRIFAHVIGAEEVWLSRLQSRASQLAVWPEITLDACIVAARANADGYDAMVKDLDDAALDRMTSYTNSAGQHFDSRVRDILTHVALHGSYHRGQVAMLLRQSGAEPMATDYIGFVRGVPAATTPVRL
jgi:uncharacterized damage-inducible protein DinB